MPSAVVNWGGVCSSFKLPNKNERKERFGRRRMLHVVEMTSHSNCNITSGYSGMSAVVPKWPRVTASSVICYHVVHAALN